MGGFLVKFLRKETWNVDEAEAKSKEGNVQIKINVFSSSACFVPKQPPSPLGKAKNGRTHRYAPTDERWSHVKRLSETMPFCPYDVRTRSARGCTCIS